MELKLSSHIIM